MIICTVSADAIADRNRQTANAPNKSRLPVPKWRILSSSWALMSLRHQLTSYWCDHLETMPSSSTKRSKKQGVLVRYFNQPRLINKLRMTVETSEPNKTLIKVLGEVLR